MKIKYFVLSTVIVGLGAVAAFVQYNAYNTPIYQPRDAQMFDVAVGRADIASMHYNLLRANPKTGEIDRKAYYKAHDAVYNNPVSNKFDVSSIYWTELGPNNVGGRTRGILQDINNTSTFYAGGVAGGMYISYDAGNNWFNITGNMTNHAISDLAQTNDGTLFIATGPGHDTPIGANNSSNGRIGNGVYKMDMNNVGSYTHIIQTTNTNSASDTFAVVNKIETNPNYNDRLYVGSQRGLWVYDKIHTDPSSKTPGLYLANGNPFNGEIDDMVVAAGGEYILASSGSNVYICTDDGTTFQEIASSDIVGATRIELAIAPSDVDIVYASAAGGDGCLVGYFQSLDRGETWTSIGSKSSSFDPLANPLGCQGNYDNAIVVDPNDPGRIIVGGVELWEWRQSQSNPPVGGWVSIARQFKAFGDFAPDPAYVHADKHRFIMPSSNVILVASDGGIAKTGDGGTTWVESNLNYNITQFYSMAVAAQPDVPGVEPIDLVMGGTQDNGTQMRGASGFGLPTNSADNAIEVRGGDGFDCAISKLSQLFFSSVYYGRVERHDGASSGTFWNPELEELCGDGAGTLGCGTFYTAFKLWESYHVDHTPDSVNFKAKVDYPAGSEVIYNSANGDVPQKAILTEALNAGDSIMLPDHVQAKFAFAAGPRNGQVNNQVYLTRDAIKLNVSQPEWSLIADGTNSYPDKIQGNIFAMNFSEDGNHLFVGTTTGQSGGTARLYRIDNLLFASDTLTTDIRFPSSVVTCTQIGTTTSIITDIAVDPNDANNLIVTTGQYGRSQNVYRGTNALSATSGDNILVSIQGDLPEMPVYGAMIDINTRNRVIVGTEYGAYISENAFQSSPAVNWVEMGNGLPRVSTYKIQQQTTEFLNAKDMPEVKNLHYKKIYVGTFGRGFFATDGLVGIDNDNGEGELTADEDETFSISVFPNPVQTDANIAFELNETSDALIQVYDISGRMVKSERYTALKAGEHTLNMDVSDLNNGTYIMSYRAEGKTATSKIVVFR